MKATAQLTFERLRFDQPTDAHLVVRLAAPPPPEASARPRVCVIPVLDVSGSMEGAKLHQAKLSILQLVDHLTPGDFCGVVVFSGQVHTLSAPTAMASAEKEALKAAVGRVQADGNTNMGGGLLAGLDHARVVRLPPGVPVRVILFTDGLANAGPAKTGEELKALLAANLGGATVSAFGYGDDADQELMQELSNLGRGNYAYVHGPEDALTAFARELGGLLSTHAQRIEVRVTAIPGLALTEVVSDVEATGDAGGVRVRVPELLADEVRDLAIGVHLAPRPVALDAPVAVAEIEVSCERLESGRLVREAASCRAMVRFVEPEAAQVAPDPDLDRAVAIAQLFRAQLDAEEAARQGHFSEAAEVMSYFQAALVTRGQHEVAAAAGRLAGTVRDESAFEASKAYRSSIRKGTSRDVGSKYDSGAEADLRAMGRGQSTDAQRSMERTFRAPVNQGGGSHRLDRRRSSRW